MDFDFVGCLAFSNYFKLPRVIRLSFARLHFFICSLMALLLDLETFKCFPALILKCLQNNKSAGIFLFEKQNFSGLELKCRL